jgi:hypothetical protein
MDPIKNKPIPEPTHWKAGAWGIQRKAAQLAGFSFRTVCFDHIPVARHAKLAASPHVNGSYRRLRVRTLPPLQGSRIMPYYRAYIIGWDGHFQNAVELDCADDKAAMESAKQFVDGHDVELWQRDRTIAKFEAKE